MIRALLVLLALVTSVWAAAQTGPPAAKPPVATTITNVFTDQDIRQIISELANLSGCSILADASVKTGEISIEFKDDTIESALQKLSYVGDLIWKKKGDLYLVSTPSPTAPLFGEFATTKVYVPKTQPAESLYGLLSRSFVAYAQLDKSANLIAITAPEQQMDRIWSALEAADGQRKQFVVEALVTEIKQGQGKESGFSWSWQHFGQAEDLGLSYARASVADIVQLKAMISNDKASLRANPSILAVEGREATLTVGTETYFSIVTGSGNYSNIQLQRISTGITLKLTGFVEPSGAINLHLQPEVSDAAAPVGGNPSTTVRRVDTYLRVEPRQTIAIGGLIQDVESKVTNKLPFLGDVPILGSVFRNSRQTKTRTEVVILITPKLLDPPAKKD